MVFFIVTILVIGLLGCQSNQTEETSSKANNPDSVSNEVEKEDEEEKYEVVIDNFNKVTTYKQVPERIVALSIGEVEICLGLGLEDKIKGIVIAEGYAKDYDESIQKIPILAEGFGATCVPSLETIIDVEPDFVYGTAFAFNADYGIAAQKDFDELGINTYVTKGTYDDVITIDDVYEDITNIGKIFNKEEEAIKLINGMKEEIAKYEIKDRSQPVKVLVCDSAEKQVSIAGGTALITSFVETVGGRNIFDDIEKQFTKVSWETIAERNPEVIVINEYEGMTSEEKINMLKSNPVMEDVEAIKNNNFVIVPLDYSLPSLKNVEAVKILAQGINKK